MILFKLFSHYFLSPPQLFFFSAYHPTLASVLLLISVVKYTPVGLSVVSSGVSCGTYKMIKVA